MSQLLASIAAAEFLQEQQSWQLFITTTNAWNPGWQVSAGVRGYRDRKPSHCSADTAVRRFERGLGNVCKMTWGPRWHRKPGAGLIWGGTLEFQKSGNPHVHALVTTPLLHLPNAFPGRKRLGNREVIPQLEEAFSKAGNGWTRVEIIRDPETVAAYCTKYVTKTGGLLVGGPWNTDTTPALARA